MSVLLKSIYVGRRAFARTHPEVLFVSVNVASHLTKLGLAVKVGTTHSAFILAFFCSPILLSAILSPREGPVE